MHSHTKHVNGACPSCDEMFVVRTSWPVLEFKKPLFYAAIIIFRFDLVSHDAASISFLPLKKWTRMSTIFPAFWKNEGEIFRPFPGRKKPFRSSCYRRNKGYLQRITIAVLTDCAMKHC